MHINLIQLFALLERENLGRCLEAGKNQSYSSDQPDVWTTMTCVGDELLL